MTAQFTRASYMGRPAGTIQQTPQAALLIDFDNVTMGIRSDLSKELKNLLGSDIIKGKVAVQRAYADWRRYPQYIVPLAEASVDLIFAPAYGSSKKNATDIRLAIDALELVFTRPEIGTYILLSGDSDFSSLVLKLKEYGKYVIGVGIRESASDLLVQNCDEYYSYSALTGLTRAGDEPPVASNDPWELVDIAVRQMTDANDVMRSDRLKQVLLELDPNFDEKTLGFSKFNRFLQEAASRGVMTLQKMENGQYEVAVPDAAAKEAAAESKGDEERNERRSRRRGRGRREGRRNGAAQDGEEKTTQAEPAAEKPADPAAPMVEASEPAADGIAAAYALLVRALKDIEKNGSARDSDVKRRMLEILPGFDESEYGFSKFSRFLRQAHEDQVVDVRKLDNGNYEVAAGDGADAVEERPRRGRRDGGRRDARPEPKEPPVTTQADSASPPAKPAPAASKPAPAESKATPTEPKLAPKPEAAKPSAAPAAAAGSPPAQPATAASRSIGSRRGSRGRKAGDGPPPLLEGQTIGSVPARPSAPADDGKPSRAESKPADADTSRGRKPAAKKRAPAAKRTAAKPARTASKPTFDAGALGLPTKGVEVVAYLASNYKGVGQKMADSLVEAFGADGVFAGLHGKGPKVKEILGEKRGEKLLEAWQDDYAFRLANSMDPAKKPSPEAAKSPRPARARRGGRRPRGSGKS